ncbi:hypothetical protein ANRL3_02091 [Anaerolineae bacterium]|nr:hypothetical protein ANRL3_02091 [Anaerolineae bacterium]
MSEMMTIAKTEFANLEERARKLAADKSFLQLTIHLMNKLSAVSGLDNVIEDMLRSVSDVIGGTNLILYYRIDNAIYYADVYGTKKTLAEVDDPRVKTAWETREPAEYEHDFSDTQMMTPEFSKAYTWIFPLLVGPDLIGVFKMESLHISMRELSQQLPTFFSYAAHVLKNEILGHTRLKHAYDDLAQEMTVRKQAEEELRLANESLEERVVARTAELQTANEQLRENEKQIKFLLDQSEQSRRALLSILEDEKRVEAALRESEEHVKQLIQASPVAMVVSTGIDEQVVLVNEKFIELFGYTIEDRPDVSHWWSLAYPDEKYREKVRTLWAARAEYAIRNKTQIEPMEAIVTCKDGDIRSIEFQLSSIGERHLVVFNDLTARKYAEQALHEREKHSQALLRLSRNLERAQTYEQVLNAARDEVRNIIGYQNLWAYLLTEDKKYAHSLVAGGPTSDTVMSEEGAATLTIQGDRMLEEIAEAKEIVFVEDAQTDERVNKEIVAKMGNRTIVNVPILLFDRHMGAVGTGTFGD